jgi:tetratricopeptide (TPR) repeat protein
MAIYQQAIERDPESVESLLGLGIAAARLGRANIAGQAYDRALELAPRDVNVRYNRANLLFEIRELDQAVDEYTRILDRDTEHLGAYENLALALQQLDRQAEATAVLERGIAALPDNLQIKNALAAQLAMSRDPADRNGSRAIELARAVFETEDPPSLRTRYVFAAALAETGAFAEAVTVAQAGADQAAEAGHTAFANELGRCAERYANDLTFEPPPPPTASAAATHPAPR